MLSAKNPLLPILMLPDPLLDVSMLSGAVLLYFDGPFIAAAPPAVVTTESGGLFKLVADRNPSWAGTLNRIASALAQASRLALATRELVQAEAPDLIQFVYYSFPADAAAYARVDDLVAKSGIDYRDLRAAATPILGLAELARHIFLEAYLQLGRNLERLYRYCETILECDSIDTLLGASYLLGLQVLEMVPPNTPILLTDEQLAPLVEQKTKKNLHGDQNASPGNCIDSDVCAWECFRVLVSRIVDPLDAGRFRLVAGRAKRNRSEVLRLRTRCRELACELSDANSIVGLGHRAAQLVEARLRRELQDMFELSDGAWRQFLTELGSDKTAWTALGSTIAGLAGASPLVTTGGAIGMVATVASTAVKVSAARRNTLQKSDLALVRLLMHEEWN